MILYCNPKNAEYSQLDQSIVLTKDYAFSSKFLSISVVEIKRRLNHIYPIDEKDVQTLVTVPPFPLIANKNIVTWLDGSFIIFTPNSNIDFPILNLIIALQGSNNKEKIFKEISALNSKISQDMMYLNSYVLQYADNIRKVAEKYRDVPYFDYLMFIQALKRKRVKYSTYGKGIYLIFNNIKVGSDQSGYILYNKIHLFMDEWSIFGFNFEFTNFDYSSMWGIEDIVLHPHLTTIYNFIGDDYNLFVDNIIYNVKEYRFDTAILKMSYIVDNFNKYRKLWNSLKNSISDRNELSKTMFTIRSNNG